MAFKLLQRGDETVDVSPLLTGVTGQAFLTRSGKVRVLRLIDIVPTTLASGEAFLTLDPGDRPAYRVDERWWASPAATTVRAGYVIPAGTVGAWSPSTDDQYRVTLTWGVA